MKFRDYISNDIHTAEDHYIVSLRTRYYRSTKANAIEKIKGIVNRIKGQIKHLDLERGEIYFETVKFSSTISVVSTSYTETAIDINMTTYSVLPLGKGKKEIEKLYEMIDKELQFIGVSLFKGR